MLGRSGSYEGNVDSYWEQHNNEELVHTIEWAPVKQLDGDSKPAYTTWQQILCQIIDISLSRQLSFQERGIVVTHEVLVRGDQQIGIDDRFENGRDMKGDVILPSATVRAVTNFDDPIGHERVQRTAYCQLQ